MESHFQTESCIKECVLDYSLFRNVSYVNTIPRFVGKSVFETGINLPILFWGGWVQQVFESDST